MFYNHNPSLLLRSDRSLFEYIQTAQYVVVIIIVVFTDLRVLVCGVMN